jgi:hypothetical protein
VSARLHDSPYAVRRAQGSLLSQRESILFSARELSIRGLKLSYEAITTLAYRLKVPRTLRPCARARQ